MSYSARLLICCLGLWRVNLKSGYHKSKMNEEDIAKIVFRTQDWWFIRVTCYFLWANKRTCHILVHCEQKNFDDVEQSDLRTDIAFLNQVLQLLSKNQMYAKFRKLGGSNLMVSTIISTILLKHHESSLHFGSIKHYYKI